MKLGLTKVHEKKKGNENECAHCHTLLFTPQYVKRESNQVELKLTEERMKVD